MEINVKSIQDIQVISIAGELDGSTAPVAQAKILANSTGSKKLIIEMSQVEYMSSAGLRMLLVTYRTIIGGGGRVALVGLSEDLRDTMSMTGFLDFFIHSPDLDSALVAIA